MIEPERPLLPPEPPLRGRCAWCGGELYAGNGALLHDGAALHPECALPYLCDRLGAGEIARCCGCRRIVL